LAVLDTTLFDGIAADPEALAQRMLDLIWGEIPPYTRTKSDQLPEEVYEQCLHHAKLLPVVLRSGRMPTRDELAFAREAARRRAHGDVPLDAFLHAFRVAHGVMWEAIHDAGDPEFALPLVGLLIEYFDLVSTQVAEAYVREEQRIHALADRERRDLVENLLVGRLPETDGPHRAAPGIDPTGQLMVVIAQVEDVDDLQHVAEALATTTKGHIGGPLVVARQAEVVALVAAHDGVGECLEAARVALRDRRGLDFVAGVSSALAGFSEVHRGYVEAEHAARQATASRPIVGVAEIPALEYLLISADAATRAVLGAKGHALQAVGPEKRAMIAETLATYVEENLNLSRTARRLGLNENTIRYRLHRIGKLTGRDPRQLSDALDLLCALRLAS